MPTKRDTHSYTELWVLIRIASVMQLVASKVFMKKFTHPSYQELWKKRTDDPTKIFRHLNFFKPFMSSGLFHHNYFVETFYMKCQSLFPGKIFLSSAEIFTQMQSGNQLRVLIFFSYFSTKTNIMVFISKWTFFLYDLYIFLSGYNTDVR